MTTDRGSRRTGGVTDPPFRLLWASQAASVLGDGLTVLLIPLLVLELTQSPVLAALASTTRTIGYLIAGVVAGTVVDRAAARRVMVTADAARALLFGALLLSTVAGAGVATILVLGFAAAAAGVFYETASAVVVQDLLRDDDLVRGNSRLELTNQLGLLLGSALVGAVVTVAGIHAATGLVSLAYLMSTVTALLVTVPAGPVRDARPAWRDVVGALRDLRDGFGYLFRHRLVRAIVGLQAMINVLVAAETLLIFFARETLGLSLVLTSIVVTAGGVGGLVGSTAAGLLARWLSGSQVIAYAIGLLSTAIALMSLTTSGVMLVALNFLIGASTVAASVNIRAIRQRVVPREMLGRITSTARTLAFVANPAGALLAGAVTSSATAGNPRPVFVVAGALGVLVAVAGYLLVLRRPHGPQAQSPSG